VGGVRAWLLYQSFPGFGRHWLPVLGSYNEHLARDVGAMYLGLMILSVGAVMRISDDYLVRLTGASWTVFNALHLIYHVPQNQTGCPRHANQCQRRTRARHSHGRRAQERRLVHGARRPHQPHRHGALP
jgi:hypothetical protein